MNKYWHTAQPCDEMMAILLRIYKYRLSHKVWLFCFLVSQHVPKHLLRAVTSAVTTVELDAHYFGDTTDAANSKLSCVSWFVQRFDICTVFDIQHNCVCVFHRAKEKKKIANFNSWYQQVTFGRWCVSSPPELLLFTQVELLLWDMTTGWQHFISRVDRWMLSSFHGRIIKDLKQPVCLPVEMW